MIFAVRDANLWWSWDDVGLMATELNIPRVPQLGIATVTSEKELQQWVATGLALAPSAGLQKEGVVVRHSASFIDEHFERCVAKWVREDHVQTPDHWKHNVITVNGKK
jgi:RNA ligase